MILIISLQLSWLSISDDRCRIYTYMRKHNHMYWHHRFNQDHPVHAYLPTTRLHAVVTWTPSIHRGPRNRPRRHSRHAPMRVLLHFILAYSHHLCSPTYPTRRKLWPRRWRVVEPRPRLEFHATPCLLQHAPRLTSCARILQFHSFLPLLASLISCRHFSTRCCAPHCFFVGTMVQYVWDTRFKVF